MKTIINPCCKCIYFFFINNSILHKFNVVAFVLNFVRNINRLIIKKTFCFIAIMKKSNYFGPTRI